MRSTRLLVTSVAIALCTQGAAVTRAHAAVVDPHARAIPSAVERAAPARSTAGKALSDLELSQHRGSQQIRAGDALLPATGDGAVVVVGSSVRIGLPAEVRMGQAEVTDSDLVVYRGSETDDPAVAVASSDSSVAVQVVIPDETAPNRYTFEIGGAVPVVRSDGGVDLLSAAGSVVAESPRPWAVDAAGNAVDTRYEVHGQSLVQVIDIDDTTTFPVVADPDFIFFAKCAAGVAIFVAENAAVVGKFYRVFKSAKAFARLMKSIKGMSRAGKISYFKVKLGSIASEASGVGDLISRCTP